MKAKKEFKGTKEDWQVQIGTPDPGNNNCACHKIYVGTQENNIADVWVSDYHFCNSLGESIANVKVMGAAKELLAVAQMVDAKYSQEKMDKKAKGYDLFLSVGESEIWGAAKKALRKAGL